MTLRRLYYLYKELKKDTSPSLHKTIKRWKIINKLRSKIWKTEAKTFKIIADKS